MKQAPAKDKFAPEALPSAMQAEENHQPASGTRGKRNFLLTVATLALAGVTARGAAAATPGNDTKDAVDADRAPAPGADGQADPGQTVHNFDIPAGPLSDVLAAMEKATGLSFAFDTEKISTVSSPGVNGVLTTQEALTALLANTGISARFDSPERVTVYLGSNNTTVEVHSQMLESPKYTVPLRDLPQTVNIITEETMQNTASTTLVDALRTVPGITFGAGEGGSPLGDRPFIRGLDTQSSTYIDGIRDIAAQSREVFDIESIEVQEGPGGAYGGRGTGGGSINMNTKLARHENFLAGSFMPGTQSYTRGVVDGNAKLGRLVSGRIVALGHNQDIAGRDGVNDQRWGAAPSLAFGLGGPTRAYLDYYHLVTNNLPDSGVPYNNPATVPTNDPGPRILPTGNGEPLTLPNRKLWWGLSDRDHERETAKIATGRVERDILGERSMIRNSFRYERTEQDYIWTLPDDSKGNIYYGLLFRRPNQRVSSVFTADDQVDMSGQFKTSKIRHSYAVGGEFSKERGNNDAYTTNATAFSGGLENCPNGAGAPSGYNCTELFSPDYHDPWKQTGIITLNHNPTHSKSVAQSAYGFDTVQFNKHFQSTVGARYDHYDSNFSTAITNGVSTNYGVINNLGTYIASLVYKPDQPTSVYGTVSTAAIPTGNALAQGVDTSALNSQINANLQPETIREEEFGAKREVSGGRALARIDFFREDIKNVRITQGDGTVAAAGNDRTLGAEAAIAGQVTRNWQLTAGYTYIDAILLNAGGTGTSNGQSMPNTPRHGVAITSSYRFFRRIRAGGGIYAMTKVWGSQPSNKWVPGYAREDLFGNYEFNKHIDLQANLQNLSNELYYDEAYPTHYAAMAPGRSALFGVNVKF